MATPIWMPGKLYPTGSLVQPATSIEPVITSLDNPGFDNGSLSGWTFTGAGTKAVTTLNSHSGTYNLACDNGEVVGINDENPPANPGLTITASVQIRLSQSGTSAGRVRLWWFDSGGTQIGSPVDGNLVQKPASRSERWVQSSLTAIAPASTASVKIGFWTNSGVGSGDTRVDTLAWDYSSASAPAGLIFKAVQPATGYSADTEPTWPSTVGVQVIDNEVIWEAVLANRVVWEASPIMVSGSTEPTWPTAVGERITDNTISWEVISRRVEDERCPNSKVVAILAGKVFAADKDIVRFSATANPLDWTSADDAGYLPTGLQQANANDLAVLNQYRSNLVAFNASSFQNWQADPNPAAMAITDQMDGVGSSWQHAAQPVSNELFYLSQLGVRTVSIANGARNLSAGDVGMPVDPLIQLAIADAIANGRRPVSAYYPGSGQYWLAFPNYPEEGISTAFIYSMTQTGNVGAWSYYLFPFAVDCFAQLGNDLYIRNGDVVSIVSEDAVADDVDGEPVEFPGTVQWPWLDFGQPGVTKMLEGFDIVSTGVPSVSIGYDQRNLAAFTDPYEVSADTLVGGIIPLPVMAPTFSVKVEFAPGQKWQLQSVLLSLYDQSNGP